MPNRPARPPRPWPERAALDPALVERLNREWRVTTAAAPGSLKQRIAAPLRQLVSAFFRPQESFNSALVQYVNHINHSNDVASERQESLRAMVEDVFYRTEVLFDRVEALGGRLDALAHHTHDLSMNVETRFDQVDAALADAQRFPEAVAARERRMDTAVSALRDQLAELRTGLGVLQHESRHLAKALSATGTGVSPAAAPPPAAATASDPLTHKYVGFEDEFRGSPEAIRAGLAAYVPLFAGASGVLDVGCGRGEFLSLLAAAGVEARGIDVNEAMVEVCRERGLEARVADALEYLREQPDGSLGGLFAAQVVEHLEPDYLVRLLDVAFDKLRPGALIVLETINPACWFAFFSSYVRDITHQQPLHPDTLRYLLVASGFQQVDIRYSSPYPEHDKLQPVVSPGVPADAAETLNANVAKINDLLFTYLDYAAIGRRP